MGRRNRDEEESFDVFSLDLLRAKRQILRYSLDEKLLLTRVSFYGFRSNTCESFPLREFAN